MSKRQSLSPTVLLKTTLTRTITLEKLIVSPINFIEYLGGGWTLVVRVSWQNFDHLQRNANNCFNSVLCVPVNEAVVTARKLSDDDIHKLALTEGRGIRIHNMAKRCSFVCWLVFFLFLWQHISVYRIHSNKQVQRPIYTIQLCFMR